MRSKTTTALAALVVSVALGACGDDGDGDGYGPRDTTSSAATTTETETAKKQPAPASAPTIVVRGGEPVGGVRELEYDAGEKVRFRVRSDVADEVHIHGYDLSEDVEAGGSVAFAFPAEIEGIFEVELEERATPIAELRVNP